MKLLTQLSNTPILNTDSDLFKSLLISLGDEKLTALATNKYEAIVLIKETKRFFKYEGILNNKQVKLPYPILYKRGLN